jgi:hypothetical protein
MKEIEPFSEKPKDPDVALAVLNGVFVWNVTNDKNETKPRISNSYKNFILFSVLILHLNEIFFVKFGSKVLLLR